MYSDKVILNDLWSSIYNYSFILVFIILVFIIVIFSDIQDLFCTKILKWLLSSEILSSACQSALILAILWVSYITHNALVFLLVRVPVTPASSFRKGKFHKFVHTDPSMLLIITVLIRSLAIRLRCWPRPLTQHCILKLWIHLLLSPILLCCCCCCLCSIIYWTSLKL